MRESRCCFSRPRRFDSVRFFGVSRGTTHRNPCTGRGRGTRGGSARTYPRSWSSLRGVKKCEWVRACAAREESMPSASLPSLSLGDVALTRRSNFSISREKGRSHPKRDFLRRVCVFQPPRRGCPLRTRQSCPASRPSRTKNSSFRSVSSCPPETHREAAGHGLHVVEPPRGHVQRVPRFQQRV